MFSFLFFFFLFFNWRVNEIFTKAENWQKTYCWYVCYFFFLIETVFNIAEDNDTPPDPHQKRAWQSLCEKIKRNSKGRPCLETPSLWHQPGGGSEFYVYSRPCKRWRPWGPVTPHLSWDKESPVSPTLLTLHRPRMLKGSTIEDEGEVKGFMTFHQQKWQ